MPPFSGTGSFDNPGRPLYPQADDLDTRRRLNKYAEHWAFYTGSHNSFIKDTGEPLVVLNYTRRVVDIITNFSFRNGFEIITPNDEQTMDIESGEGEEEDERFFVKRILDDMWRKNNKVMWCIEAGQTLGVTGDLFVFTSWDTTDPRFPEGYVRNDILPSHFVFPVYGGADGRDRKRMQSVLILWPVIEEHHQTGKLDTVWFGEEWTAETKIVFRNGVQISIEDNPLGEIPVTHARNYPVAGQSFGLSDVDDIVSLNKEVNEKSTDVSEIIFYHGSPITYLIGAKVEQLERGASRVWSLPEGTTIGNLEISGDLAAARGYIEDTIARIKELAGVPETAFGQKVGVGDVTGVALLIQWLPLVQIRDVKIESLSDSLIDVHRLSLKTYALALPGFADELEALTDPYRVDVKFKNPMPRDEKHELELARERLTLGLSTKKMELERMGHGEKNIKKILEDAAVEQAETAQAEFQASAPSPFQNSEGSANRATDALGV